MEERSDLIVLIKGGGEVASGVAHRLHRSRLRVCLTEIEKPLAVTRGVTFSEAVFDGFKTIMGVTAERTEAAPDKIYEVWKRGYIAIAVDPTTSLKDKLNPDVLVDAIMVKRNTGTSRDDAPLVIGLGPGFYASRDVHMVVETNNSENLGRIIFDGRAEEDTGIPVAVGGLSIERVIHSPEDGLFLAQKQIGDTILTDETVASVAGHPVKVKIDGIVRALLKSNIEVKKGTKLGEVDPTACVEHCYSIRPRMRAIAGGVLEAIMIRFNT